MELHNRKFLLLLLLFLFFLFKTNKQSQFFLRFFLRRFLLRKIEMTINFHILSFIQCPRKTTNSRIYFPKKQQTNSTHLGMEMTPGSLMFFNSSFQTSSLPLTAYFESFSSCIIRSISSDCRLRMVAATSF